MLKGVLIGFVVMIVLALIPIVHIAGIPFGPFFGGYFGISAVDGRSASPGSKAFAFGTWTGVLMLVVLAVSATIAIAASGVSPILLWIGVVVFTLYYGSMAGLGAWYAELKTNGGSDPRPRF